MCGGVCDTHVWVCVCVYGTHGWVPRCTRERLLVEQQPPVGFSGFHDTAVGELRTCACVWHGACVFDTGCSAARRRAGRLLARVPAPVRCGATGQTGCVWPLESDTRATRCMCVCHMTRHMGLALTRLPRKRMIDSADVEGPSSLPGRAASRRSGRQRAMQPPMPGVLHTAGSCYSFDCIQVSKRACQAQGVASSSP